ncbi:CubicO group peptidase (beta-lactamase class C family) [Ilumatobacter fluminis]|uniref:CubicO group peptidase (Beta-lactamase class C family) n=1 Tax=Ilumatobacter fluminis TaxID=467091 RepID=A0A4R7HVE1_9ACTN|nr:serine hydrolase [Ilumatobacter fluminis]TDT14795.1 CubicO group peptidase (beta-lactamase class C family) [Ilumatobacter fluminis]
MSNQLHRVAASTGGSSAEWEPPRQYADELPAPTVAVTSSRRKRDDSLDVMRTVALVRVVVWHAFGIAFISWVVATMPIMFFVAGSLLAGSLDRMRVRDMYRKRLKRLLVPYWFFGGTVLLVAQFAYLMDPTVARYVEPSRVFAWIFPVVDPSVSLWEGGWASSPMWYLRVYLWLLVLSPVLRWAVKRFGSLALLPSVVIAAVMEMWLHHPTAVQGPTGLVPSEASWMLGETALFSFFLMLGFLHHDGAFERLTTWAAAEWMLIAAVGTFLWWTVFPAPTGVINHSFIGLLASGIGWIALFLVAKPWLLGATDNDIGKAIVYWFTARAMSVYLWHSPAIAIGYWLMGGIAPDAARIWVLVPTAALTVLAVVLFGWIEDIASGQPARLWPRPAASVMWRWPDAMPWGQRRGNAVLSGLALGLLAATTFAAVAVNRSGADSVSAAGPTAAATASADESELPPPPSGSPAIADFGDSTDAADTTSTDTELPPAPSGSPDIADFGESSDDGATETDDSELPPAPSGSPDIADFGSTDTADAADAVAPTAASGDLDSVVADWLAAKGVDGVRVAVVDGAGTMTTAAVGDVALDDVVPITSTTKTMTAAIILDLAEQGVLDLDGPLPAVAALPEFPYNDQITIRQLLMHTSGLVAYQSATGYDQTQYLTDIEAVTMSGNTPLEWEPGTARGYSNSGFLLLGLIAEQVTGRPYADLVADRTAALGLTTMQLDDNQVGGWVGSSAGGLEASVVDLATWGSALFQQDLVLSPEMVAEMTDVSNDFRAGLGAFPVCPCSVAEDGTPIVTSIGHNGGEVSVQYSPSDDLVVAVSLTESLWTDELNEQDVYDLLASIRTTF